MTDTTCVLCPRHAEPDLFTCQACQTRLVRQLGDMETYLPILTPLRATQPAERSSPGYRSTSPANDDVIAMTDPRSNINGSFGVDDEYPIYAAANVLGGWVRILVTHRPVDGVELGSLVDAARLLRTHAGWLCAQPWIDEAATELGTLHRQLRTAVGDSPPKPIAKCWDLTSGPPCEGPVFWTLNEPPEARCHRCQRRYTGLDLVRLQMSNEQEAG